MKFEQRMYARLKFLDLMADLYESAFEDFFHRVMVTRYPSFLDVRTHGNLGDQGADGLTLHSRKLYACYAPQTGGASAVKTKFTKDLASAVRQRDGQFDTFVFVHNDRRGIHPQVATMLSTADSDHPALDFEQMGTRHIWQECMGLDLALAEDVLGCEIPVKPTVYGMGMDDLAPLLQHLKELRAEADPLMELPQVREEKLDFNQLLGESRDALLRGMRHTPWWRPSTPEVSGLWNTTRSHADSVFSTNRCARSIRTPTTCCGSWKCTSWVMSASGPRCTGRHGLSWRTSSSAATSSRHLPATGARRGW
nr:hypothetical protein [Streptomyces lushanensis]